MAQKPLTALVGINRHAARQRIQERIDQAKAVIPNPIQTQDDLSNAEEREKKWHAYNVELLARLFTTDEYADEYRNSKISVHRIADRYDDPSFNTLALRLIESVKRQVARLESIIERLELVDEMAADQPEATAPQDCSKVFVVPLWVASRRSRCVWPLRPPRGKRNSELRLFPTAASPPHRPSRRQVAINRPIAKSSAANAGNSGVSRKPPRHSRRSAAAPPSRDRRRRARD
jgi:hypothetical protein